MISNHLRSHYGLNLFWDAKDRDEVFEHNKKLWQEVREDEGLKSEDYDTKIEGFAELIQDIHLQGYGFTDIGVMFGIERNKIDYYFKREGLQRNLSSGPMYIVPNGSQRVFGPIDAESLESLLDERYRSFKEKESRKRQEERVEKIKNVHVQTLQEFEREKGRAPIPKEIAEILGYKSGDSALNTIIHYWGYDEDNDVTASQAMDNLYAAAGVKRVDGRSLREFEPRGPTVAIEREPGTLGSRLTYLRLERELLQKEVADILGLANTSVNRHELNEVDIKDENLEKYAELYDVTTDWLLSGEPTQP